jgi:hypothetical protein
MRRDAFGKTAMKDFILLGSLAIRTKDICAIKCIYDEKRQWFGVAEVLIDSPDRPMSGLGIRRVENDENVIAILRNSAATWGLTTIELIHAGGISRH